jgi:hypothetical protein
MTEKVRTDTGGVDDPLRMALQHPTPTPLGCLLSFRVKLSI